MPPGGATARARGEGVSGGLAMRLTGRWRIDGRRCVEFSWQGDDEGDHVSGRGWAAQADHGTLDGHLFFHLCDDSAFHAVPSNLARLDRDD